VGGVRSLAVVGLGFGDEGKGTVVDFLARSEGADLVVRFNGGPQAGHNVVTPEGTWHCFAQLGAGLFQEGTRSHAAAGMLVELEALAREAEVLATRGVPDALDRLSVDADATMITPFQKMLGQMGEIARGKGTCGMGVGSTVALRERGLFLRVGDVGDAAALRAGLRALKRHAAEEAARLLAACPSDEMRDVHAWFVGRGDVEALAAAYERVMEGVRVAATGDVLGGEGVVVFEGAQGALLDREHGFRPWITPSPTTWDLDLAPAARVVGVLRPYAHRHGPGPLVTEDASLAEHLRDPRNPWNRWQGAFRVGWLDVPALRHAIALQPRLDALALTCLDRLGGLPEIRAYRAYRYEGDLGLLDGFEHERAGPSTAIVHRLARSPLLSEVVGRCAPWDPMVLPGWEEDVSTCRRIEDLPENARRLVTSIEGLAGVPLDLVSVDPTAGGKMSLTR